MAQSNVFGDAMLELQAAPKIVRPAWPRMCYAPTAEAGLINVIFVGHSASNPGPSALPPHHHHGSATTRIFF